jgi:hypothetical protein
LTSKKTKHIYALSKRVVAANDYAWCNSKLL